MPLGLKDIHEALRSLEREGYDRSQLEALLIHSDDLSILIETVVMDNGNAYPVAKAASFDKGLRKDLKLFGVKIIENEYVERGSIFKIFKNGPLSMHPQGFDFNRTITMPEELKSPTVADEKKENKKYSDKRRIDLR